MKKLWWMVLVMLAFGSAAAYAETSTVAPRHIAYAGTLYASNDKSYVRHPNYKGVWIVTKDDFSSDGMQAFLGLAKEYEHLDAAAKKIKKGRDLEVTEYKEYLTYIAMRQVYRNLEADEQYLLNNLADPKRIRVEGWKDAPKKLCGVKLVDDRRKTRSNDTPLEWFLKWTFSEIDYMSSWSIVKEMPTIQAAYNKELEKKFGIKIEKD